jgi:hypothetical protein
MVYNLILAQGWRAAPRRGSFGLWNLSKRRPAPVLWRTARTWGYIYPVFSVSAAKEKKGVSFKGFVPISSLGLRGLSLRLFLVFGTSFFHLVITYH